MKKKERTPAPWMIIIAGPNGAGKSTFYETVFKEDYFLKGAPFINLDNMAKEIAEKNGTTDPDKYMICAGKILVDQINKQIDKKENFIYETTSSGKLHLRFIDDAKAKGYKIATIFIGLSNPILSLLRVKQRVENGGHNVSHEDIFRRYPKIIKNFPEMLKRSDVGAVFDNSERENPYRMIFLMDNRAVNVFYKYPKWLEEAIKERKTRKEMVFMYDKNMVDRFKKEEILEIMETELLRIANKSEKRYLTPELIKKLQEDNRSKL